VNIILFSPSEVELPLARSDVRACHLLGTLRRGEGDTFDAGLIDGPRGRGTIVAIGEHELTLAFAWGESPPPLLPVHLIIGLPRPQTARDILRDATTLGVSGIHFVRSERGEASYAASSLWSSGEWQRQVVAGAAQAFCTRLPAITHGRTLTETLAALPANRAPADASAAIAHHRFMLDNYEATGALATASVSRDGPWAGATTVVLAIGSERGWSPGERELFRAHGFALVHLGPRVLRTETAVVAAVTLARAKLESA
jgi:RsmE family RNA methyltransferase